MPNCSGQQTVSLAHKETKLLSSIEGTEPVHIDIDLMLTFEQREVYNMIVRQTVSDAIARRYLIGVFIAFGAPLALNELRKKFPTRTFELSGL